VVVPLSEANQPYPGKPGDCEEQAAIGDDPAVPALAGDAFPPGLLDIWADPEVRRLAVRRAGDPDLAEDALQQAVCAVAQIGNLGRIKDLKAYFCRVLINEVYHLRGQLAAARACVPLTEVTEARLRGRPSDEATAVLTGLMARTWLDRFRAQRDRLRASVPGRSSQPSRYRDLIVAVAENILVATVDGSISQADSNERLQAAFPEWFGQPGAAANTCHQHLSRARRDVQALLQGIVSRDDLIGDYNSASGGKSAG
jgi:hypothetical protein